MTVQARWNGTLIAQSDNTVLVEGNHYFPPGDVAFEFLEDSDTSTHCIWKGDASYFTVVARGERSEDAAWFYAAPFDAAAGIKDYIAFWKGVQVSGSNPGEPEIVPPNRPVESADGAS